MIFSPELQFVIDCCRACFREGQAKPVEVSPQLDWERIVRLSRFHRVQGLVWKALSALDRPLPAPADDLASDAALIAASSLRASAACQALLSSFEQERLRLLFLKGLPLGVLAYGSSALKASVDIDVLVDPDQLRPAASLIESQGFELTIPNRRPGLDSLVRWHRVRKESLWANRATGVHVDLHTRAADNSNLIATIGLRSETRMVDLGNGVELPTLGPTENFAYLAVHGASSAWFRLKWISDFAALLAGASADELEMLHRRSQQLRAGRAAGQALLLADRVFGTLESNPSLRRELQSDRGAMRLYSAALEQLAGRAEPVEPTSVRLGTLRIHWTQFFLLPGIGFKLSELQRQARSMLA